MTSKLRLLLAALFLIGLIEHRRRPHPDRGGAKTGTLAWELDVVKTHGLDKQGRSADLEITELASHRGRQDRPEGRLGRSRCCRTYSGWRANASAGDKIDVPSYLQHRSAP